MRDPTVLIIDDEFRTDLYEFWLRGTCTVEKASTYEEARNAIRETLCVVLLRQEFARDFSSELEKEVKRVAPYCRFGVTTSSHSEVVFPDVDCDVSVSEPITEEKILETVDRLLGRALYLDALRHYYRLTVRVTNLEIADQKEAKRGEYERRRAELQGLADYLNEIKTRLNPDELSAVLESLRMKEPLPRQSEGRKVKPEKYRPNRCAECKVAWSTDAAERSGHAFESLGAFTWKCTDCGAVQNVPSPSDRKIAR